MTPDELAAIRERDAGRDVDEEVAVFPDSPEAHRRALLAHIDAITAAVEGLPWELVDKPLSDRYIHRAAVLAILRGE